MTTQGDRILDRPLAEVGGKGLFIKELELAMAEGRADIAVHSMKDVPSELPPGMTLAAMLPRADPRDAFVSSRHASFDALPQGARVGTSSLRRQCQLKHARPDLELVTLRGNVDTRLRKLDEGQYDAIILAAAGLIRLGLGASHHSLLRDAISRCRPWARASSASNAARTMQRSIALVARAERRNRMAVLRQPSARSRSACRAAANRRSPVSPRSRGDRAASARRHRVARRARTVSRREFRARSPRPTRSASRSPSACLTRAREQLLDTSAPRRDVIPKVIPPLTDLTVLVTRPAAQCATLCAADRAPGRRRHRVSCDRDRSPLDGARSRTTSTSSCSSASMPSRTARSLIEKDRPRASRPSAERPQPRWRPRSCLPTSFLTRGFDSEALLAHPDLTIAAAARVLIVRGDGGRELLQETFARRGAVVETREVYRRVRPIVDDRASRADRVASGRPKASTSSRSRASRRSAQSASRC